VHGLHLEVRAVPAARTRRPPHRPPPASADLQLARESLKLDGRFTVDEALFDFSKSNAPSLDEDVVVVRAASAPGEATPRNPRVATRRPCPPRSVKRRSTSASAWVRTCRCAVAGSTPSCAAICA
jgi:hypothetical protein